jgi:hypothetical protein
MRRFHHGQNPYVSEMYQPFANNIAGGMASFGSQIPKILSMYNTTVYNQRMADLQEQKMLMQQTALEEERAAREEEKELRKNTQIGLGNFMKELTEYNKGRGSDGFKELSEEDKLGMLYGSIASNNGDVAQIPTFAKNLNIVPMTAAQKANQKLQEQRVGYEGARLAQDKLEYRTEQEDKEASQGRINDALESLAYQGSNVIEAAQAAQLTGDELEIFLDKAQMLGPGGGGGGGMPADPSKIKGSTPYKFAVLAEDAARELEQTGGISAPRQQTLKMLFANAIEEKVTENKTTGSFMIDLREDNMADAFLASPVGKYLGLNQTVEEDLKKRLPGYRVKKIETGVFKAIPKGTTLSPKQMGKMKEQVFQGQEEKRRLDMSIRILEKNPDLARLAAQGKNIFEKTLDAVFGTEEPADVSQLRSTFEALNFRNLNKTLKERSGAAVTESEYKRLMKEINALGPNAMLAKLKAHSAIIDATTKAYLEMIDNGVIEYDKLDKVVADTVDRLLAEAGGKPATQGSKSIGDWEVVE